MRDVKPATMRNGIPIDPRDAQCDQQELRKGILGLPPVESTHGTSRSGIGTTRRTSGTNGSGRESGHESGCGSGNESECESGSESECESGSESGSETEVVVKWTAFSEESQEVTCWIEEEVVIIDIVPGFTFPLTSHIETFTKQKNKVIQTLILSHKGSTEVTRRESEGVQAVCNRMAPLKSASDDSTVSKLAKNDMTSIVNVSFRMNAEVRERGWMHWGRRKANEVSAWKALGREPTLERLREQDQGVYGFLRFSSLRKLH
jgi:hypothetical protein